MSNRAHRNSPRFLRLARIQAHLMGFGTPHSWVGISPFRTRSPLLRAAFTDLLDGRKSKPTGEAEPVAEWLRPRWSLESPPLDSGDAALQSNMPCSDHHRHA